MLYTVELNYSDPATVEEWSAWYDTYLQQLVTVPGLRTAQRYRAVNGSSAAWEYLAIYSLISLDVYTSESYLSIGGGGNASKAYHHAISRRRNVYAGIDVLPAVSAGERLLFTDTLAAQEQLPDLPFTVLKAAAGAQQAGATRLDGTPAERSIAIVTQQTAEQLSPTALDGISIYAPLSAGQFRAGGA